MSLEPTGSAPVADPPADGADRREIHFTVDGEPCETDSRELTPNQIITEFAHKDPSTNYLVQIEGHHRVSYEGKGNQPIIMHDSMRFQVISTGPTPVS